MCSHPAVLHHLRTSGERLLLLGHRSKWETVIIPDEVADVVVVLESLPYTVCAVPAPFGVKEPVCAAMPVGAAMHVLHKHTWHATCRRAWPLNGLRLLPTPLPPQLYFDTLSRCRAIMLAFATGAPGTGR